MNHLLARTEYHKQGFYSETTLFKQNCHQMQNNETMYKRKVAVEYCIFTGLSSWDEFSVTTVQPSFLTFLAPCSYNLVFFAKVSNILLKDFVCVAWNYLQLHKNIVVILLMY